MTRNVLRVDRTKNMSWEMWKKRNEDTDCEKYKKYAVKLSKAIKEQNGSRVNKMYLLKLCIFCY